MKAIGLVLTAMLVVYASFAQSKTEKEITVLSKNRVKWLLKGELDSLASLYAENSITVHGNGMVRSTAEHLEDIKSGRPVYKSIDITDTSVQEFGNTAILVGKGVFSISINGSEITANMAFTEVYVRKGKSWKLAARHASQIQ